MQIVDTIFKGIEKTSCALTEVEQRVDTILKVSHGSWTTDQPTMASLQLQGEQTKATLLLSETMLIIAIILTHKIREEGKNG